MKKVLQLLAGTTLALAAASSHAAIALPVTGTSELFLAVTNGTSGGQLFVMDLGIPVSTFDTTMNQTFTLSGSNWNAMKSLGNLYFAVAGANSSGNSTNTGRVSLLTSTAGANPVAPTNTKHNGIQGSFNTFVQSTNQLGTHPTVANGTSLQTATSGNGSFANFATVWLGSNGYGIQTVAAGSNAELFRVSNSGVSPNNPATVVDFYKSTETPANLGGYFSLNASTGKLTYQAAPVPEASEWAMMLAGLGVVGAMVRRRRPTI